MVLCPKCGTLMENTAAFCPNCGTPKASAPAPAAYPQGQPAPQQAYYSAPPAYAPQAPVPLDRNAAPKLIRSFAKSPLYIVAAAAFTVSLILGMIQAFSAGSSVLGSLSELFPDQAGEEVRNMLDTVQTTSGFASFSAFLPSIIIAAGLWITFASANGGSETPLATAGLTMIKVLMIIELVFLCIGAALLLIGMILVMAFGSSAVSDASSVFGGDFANVAYGLLIAIFFVALLVMVFVILFFVKIIGSINTAKRTLATGMASDKISSFVAVILFIDAAGVLLSVFSVGGDPLSILKILCDTVSYAAFGVLMFRYKSAMRPLMYQNPYAV